MGEWIKVTDRLPSPHKHVAILISAYDVAIENYPTCAYLDIEFRGTDHERKRWWAGVPGKYDSLNSWEVTHWAELPEVKKGQGHGTTETDRDAGIRAGEDRGHREVG